MCHETWNAYQYNILFWPQNECVPSHMKLQGFCSVYLQLCKGYQSCKITWENYRKVKIGHTQYLMIINSDKNNGLTIITYNYINWYFYQFAISVWFLYVMDNFISKLNMILLNCSVLK